MQKGDHLSKSDHLSGGSTPMGASESTVGDHLSNNGQIPSDHLSDETPTKMVTDNDLVGTVLTKMVTPTHTSNLDKKDAEDGDVRV